MKTQSNWIMIKEKSLVSTWKCEIFAHIRSAKWISRFAVRAPRHPTSRRRHFSTFSVYARAWLRVRSTTAITYGVTADRVLKKPTACLGAYTFRFFQNTLAVAIIGDGALAFYDRVDHTSHRVLRFKSRRTHVGVLFSREHVAVFFIFGFCSEFANFLRISII